MTPALAGVLAYLVLGMIGRFGPGRLCAALAILSGLASLALWAPGFPEVLIGGPPWGIALGGDTLALAFWCFIPVVHAAVTWHERRRDAAFHSLVTLLVGTCLATVLSRDLFNLYVTLELASLLSFLLIAYEGKARAVWASLRYLILAAVGMILYLFGVGLVYGALGTLSLSRIAASVSDLSHPPLAIGAGLLVAGAAVKAGVFLVGLWLPAAYGEAPVGVTTLLAGLVGKMGIVTLARLAEALPVGPAVVALGVITGFGGLLYALWEKDLKLFLSHHVISQIGYMLIGFGLGGPAFLGGILYTAAHCLFKGLLFQAGGVAVEAVGRRDIPSLAGKIPRAAAWGLALGTGAIVGLPPLAGYVSKEYLGLLAPPALSWTLTVLAIGTAASFCKIVPLLRPGREVGPRGAIALLAAGVLGFSVWGMAHLPGILDAGVWTKAVGAVAAGYLAYLGLRRHPARLPAITLDRVATAILLGAAALAAGILLLG